MDFDERLKKAVARGRHTRDSQAGAEEAKALSEKDLRNLHSGYRLELTEYIEKCLHSVADQFPGFEFKTIVSDEGWGASITRDDVGFQRGAAANYYSRLELLIKPFSDTHIVALVAKGTVRNKETISRNHFHFLKEFDMDSFRGTIDLWVLEYAEKYAATV